MKLLFWQISKRFCTAKVCSLLLFAVIIGATVPDFAQSYIKDHSLITDQTLITPRKTPRPTGNNPTSVNPNASNNPNAVSKRRARDKKQRESETTYENQNNIKFPDEYSDLDNLNQKKSQDKAIARILDRAKQKYLQALKLIQKGDTLNAARFFEHAIDILNKGASKPGMDNNEEFSELAQSIIDDYETYIKSIDELDASTSMALVRDRLFQEFEKIQTTPEMNQELKEHKPLPTLTTPTNLVIPLDSNELVDKSIIFLTERPAGKAFFNKILSNSTRWFPMMKRIAREEGMPEEIIMISTFESGLNPNAVSSAGAVGLWQFMRATGKDYGLNARPSIWLDERRDPEKSTRAAMRYLKALHQDFGDWYLAMSAYNAGPGRIRGAMRKIQNSDSINYWAVMKALNIKETRGYAPMFIAITKIMYNLDKFGIDKSKIQFQPEYKYDTYTLREPVSLDAIAQAAGTNLQEIKDLNPELINGATPADLAEYKVKIPYGSHSLFSQNFSKLTPEEKMPWVVYVTKSKRETMASIAQKYGISVAQLASANEGLSSKGRLGKGVKLKIPVGKADEALESNVQETRSNNAQSNSSRQSNSLQAPNPTVITNKKMSAKELDRKYKNYPKHKVAKGETIFTIALRYGMRPAELKEMNGLPADDDRIREGQMLRVSPSGDFSVSDTPSATKGVQNTNTGSAPNFVNHTVRKNESLAQIAAKYDVSVKEIKKYNKIGKKLKAGKVLKIPTTKAEQATPVARNTQPAPAAVPSNKPIKHLVRKGETLEVIAKKYNVTIDQIKAQNPTKVRGDVIQANTQLEINPNVSATQADNAKKADRHNKANETTAKAKNNKSKKKTKIYTIKAGDTLEKIARKHNMTVDELAKINGKNKNKILQIGEKLKVE